MLMCTVVQTDASKVAVPSGALNSCALCALPQRKRELYPTLHHFRSSPVTQPARRRLLLTRSFPEAHVLRVSSNHARAERHC